MKTSNFFAPLLVAVSMTASVTADFTVTPGRTKAVVFPENNANFAKEWTLEAGRNTDTVDSLHLDLAGRVHVRYTDTLPEDVLGYVNVTGSAKAVVDAVKVGNSLINVIDGDDDSDSDDENVDNKFDLRNIFDRNDNLFIRLGNRKVSGYLLTEVVLAHDTVWDVKSAHSAQVVIEDGVLVTDSKKKLRIEATDSSAIFVSAAETAVSVRQLILSASGTAKIEYKVGSVAVQSGTYIETQDSATISVLSPSLTTHKLALEAESPDSICISAEEIEAKRRKIDGRNKISMPNSANKHGTTGIFQCQESALPPRQPLSVTGNAAATTAENGALSLDGDLSDPEANLD
ncbi:hypothetical protein PHYBOEH_010940 [Phytophthora boehmeriae]|uniref:Auto-transporter adhesin head GIN domain-containing protein n=1 Tax=Phytophthora boehmeriae TaxID=109152 RepID=A0A8T1X373_9STRA|nr:hypothetical protein PHYBOEH_010940 [Phytophthora boehmeriae]